MDAKLLSHVDNGSQDDLGLLVGLEGPKEIHIDLQIVKLIVLKVVKRTVACPEVVHPHFIAGISESLYLVSQEIRS